MEEHTQSFTPLLVVVGAAMVTGILLPRLKVFRIPMVVGEILIGILLGRSGIGLIEGSGPMLALLSGFGLAFLMFLSGLEIDVRSLSVKSDAPLEGKRKPVNLRSLLVVTFLIFGATLGSSLALSFGLVAFDYLETPYLMALIMSTTSVGLVMPLLKERGEASTPFGQTLILGAVVADFSTMLLITVVAATFGTEDSGAIQTMLFVGTLFVLFFLVLFFGKYLLTKQDKLVKQIAFTAPKTAEMPVRVAMTLLLGFVVFAEAIGNEVIILAAFLAGTAVSSLSRKSVHGMLGLKLDAIGYGFFIPIFFIKVGAELDIRTVLEDSASLVLVPVLVIFAFLVKVIPNLLLAQFYGTKNALAAGFLLSSRLSLIIAAAAMAREYDLISDQINTSIVLVAVLTCIVSPPIYAKLRGKPQVQRSKHVDLNQFIGQHIQKTAMSSLELQLVEIDAKLLPFVLDRTLRDSCLRQKTGLTLIAVTQADGTVVDNPGPDFQITLGDSLFMIGTERQVTAVESKGMMRLSPLPPPPPGE